LDKIRILIADDHAVVREGTRRILEREEGLEVIAEAADGEEAVRRAAEFKPDVAIIDIAMPKLDGIEATRQIKALSPGITVLILSAYDDDQFVFSLLEAGAAGYLLKDVREGYPQAGNHRPEQQRNRRGALPQYTDGSRSPDAYLQQATGWFPH